MKTIKSIIIVAVMAGLTTSNILAQEVTQKASVSPSSCTQYKDSKSQSICLNIAEIDYIIEQLPVKMDLAKKKLKSIQTKVKIVLNAIDQHLTTSKLNTSSSDTIRRLTSKYNEQGFGKDLHGYKEILNNLEEEALSEYNNAQRDTADVFELEILRKGYKVQLDAIKELKDLK